MREAAQWAVDHVDEVVHKVGQQVEFDFTRSSEPPPSKLAEMLTRYAYNNPSGFAEKFVLKILGNEEGDDEFDLLVIKEEKKSMDEIRRVLKTYMDIHREHQHKKPKE